MSDRKIGRALRISKTTVSAYLAVFSDRGLEWPEASRLTDEALAAVLFPPHQANSDRMARLYAHFEAHCDELGKKGMTRELLWEEYQSTEAQPYS
jgi:hypothetical protein